MKYLWLASGILLTTGCQSVKEWQTQEQAVSESSMPLNMYQNELFNGHQDAAYVSHWARNPHAYLNQATAHIRSDSHLNISDYVQGMSLRLVKNMRYVTDKTPMAVTSFVPIDSNLEATTLFGNHLAESFQHNMQNLGLAVIDYKATGTIRVTETGDYALSRDIDELRHDHPIEYILTGTFTQKEEGVEVYARVVGVESRAVVASSKALIPRAVAEQLLSSKPKTGVNLVNQ